MRNYLVRSFRNRTHGQHLKAKLRESVKRFGMRYGSVTVNVQRTLLEIEHEYIKLSLGAQL